MVKVSPQRSENRFRLWLMVVSGIVAVSILLGVPGTVVGAASDVVTERFREPLGSTEAAKISVNASIGDVHITALDDSTGLIDAAISHLGEIDFVVDGDREKNVSISQRQNDGGLQWQPITVLEEVYWNIGINPDVPVALQIENGIGAGRYDLSALQLVELELKVGVGSVQVDLPSMSSAYDVRVNGSAGGTTISVPEDAAANLRLQTGIGEFVVDVPYDAAVRVVATSEIGSVNVPSDFIRTSREGDGLLGDGGVWETEGFSEAERQILIEFAGEIGGLTVR
jgi:hypothetical protein